jgi:hypothetical protein
MYSLSVKVEMNLLSLINSWLNKFYQITTKVLQEYFSQVLMRARALLLDRGSGSMLCLLPKKTTVQTKDSSSHQTCDTYMEY